MEKEDEKRERPIVRTATQWSAKHAKALAHLGGYPFTRIAKFLAIEMRPRLVEKPEPEKDKE